MTDDNAGRVWVGPFVEYGNAGSYALAYHIQNFDESREPYILASHHDSITAALRKEVEALKAELAAYRAEPHGPGCAFMGLKYEDRIDALTKERDELKAWNMMILDKPEDRLYHAADRTWWKRDVDWTGAARLVRADAPDMEASR